MPVKRRRPKARIDDTPLTVRLVLAGDYVVWSPEAEQDMVELLVFGGLRQRPLDLEHTLEQFRRWELEGH